MIITLFVQVLQELNAILLIVAPLLAPPALIIVHRLVGPRAHNFSFVFFLGSIMLEEDGVVTPAADGKLYLI
jgi:hypothetical protein